MAAARRHTLTALKRGGVSIGGMYLVVSPRGVANLGGGGVATAYNFFSRYTLSASTFRFNGSRQESQR